MPRGTGTKFGMTSVVTQVIKKPEAQTGLGGGQEKPQINQLRESITTDRFGAGVGDKVMRFNTTEGFWIGNRLFTSAPFSVDLEGNMVATKITASNIKTFEAVVDASGGGDYSTLEDAVAAGETSIFMRNGSYTLPSSATIKLLSDTIIEGESYGGVLISGNTGTAGIEIGGVSNITIRNLKFIDIKTDGGQPSKTIGFNTPLSTDVLIEKCIFDFTGTTTDLNTVTAIGGTTSLGVSERVTIQNCLFTGVFEYTGTNTNILTGIKNVGDIIINNYFIDLRCKNSSSFALSQAFNHCIKAKDDSIISNNFFNISYSGTINSEYLYGIYAQGVNNTQIINNKFIDFGIEESSGSTVVIRPVFLTSSENNIVSNNSIQPFKSGAGSNSYYAVDLTLADNNVVSNNMVVQIATNPILYGISISISNKNNIVGNNLYVSDRGIRIDGDKNIADNNYCFASFGLEIITGSDRNIATSNMLVDATTPYTDLGTNTIGANNMVA